MKPEIRFEWFEDEWEINKFNEFGQLINGRAYKQNELLSEGKYKVLRVGNFYTNDSWYYSNLQLDEKYYANYGDLLYTWSASFGPHIWKGDTVIYHYHIWKITLDNGIDKQFVRTLLNYDKAKILNGSNGSTMVHITKSGMENKLFGIPSTEEQEQIGNYFAKLDKSIELKQKELDKLKQFKQTMLQKMFPKEGETVPEIRFEGYEDEWLETNLNDNGRTFSGLSGKTKEDFGHGTAKYVPYKNIFNNAITDRNNLEKIEIDSIQTEVQYGDVFFTTSSEVPEEVGMSSVWTYKDENIYLNSFCFGYRPTTQFNNNFLAYMLRTPLIRNQFTLLAQGISRYNISKNKSIFIKLFIPPLEEQKLIGDYFYKLDKQITNKEKELDKLNHFKQAMLDKMFV